jgi:uncharacterized protein YjbJ (UPF0337 family)
MNEDRITGTARNVAGQVEEGYGRVTGDAKSELQGKLRQAEGAAQQVYGQVKDQVKQTASGAVDAVSAGVDKADDVLRDMIEHHPYTTALVALGVGMLIGKLSSRHSYY